MCVLSQSIQGSRSWRNPAARAAFASCPRTPSQGCDASTRLFGRGKFSKNVRGHFISRDIAEDRPLVHGYFGVEHGERYAMGPTEVAHGRVSSSVAYLHHRTVVTVKTQSVLQYGHISVSNGTATTDRGLTTVRYS